MNYQEAISHSYDLVKMLKQQGTLADYIPELANIDPSKLGAYIATIDQNNFGIGDYQEAFSIQSISKVFNVCLAYKILGEDIWKRLGVEPSGDKFNSLVLLDQEKGIPRNPFINAGAIVVADILLSHLDNPKENVLSFIKEFSNCNNIYYNPEIASSEKSVGYRNIAICNFIKSYGNIENEPEDVLDLYYDLCSLETDCETLSHLFLFLANQGKTLHTQKQILSPSQTKRINAVMQTCGIYDESGEFAYRVGISGKSGVGGGIVAILPGNYAITVWSPKLNAKGNSYKGIRFLEEFTTLSEKSIF